MSDNYDFPPATTPSANNSPLPASLPPNPGLRRASEISARLQHLRNMLDTDRQRNTEQRRAMDALDREMLEMSAEPISTHLDRRRRGLDSTGHENESTTHDLLDSQGPSTLMRARRRAIRPSERLQRHRDRLNETTIPRVDSQSPGPPINDFTRNASPEMAIREYSGEAQLNRENRLRAKRRKLDSDDTQEGSRAFRYGHRGQVVPGPLNLELVSCDGGQYTGQNGDASWPYHVLLDDFSVFCIKTDRCNIVLRHVGSIPFSLRRLVIKAPRNGFDAPVQEGMIFVSMSDNDLLSRTAQYQIQYTPKRSRRNRHHRPEQSQIRLAPSHDYFSTVRSPMRSPLRSIDRSSFVEEASSSTGPNINPPLQVPGFRVTTDFEDIWDAEEAGSSQSAPTAGSDIAEPVNEQLGALLDRNIWPQNLGASYFSSGEEDSASGSSSSDDDENIADLLRNRGVDFDSLTTREQRIASTHYTQQMRDWRRARRAWEGRDINRRATPSRIGVANANGRTAPPGNARNVATTTESTSATAEPSTPEVLAPHARFLLRRDKSCVSIKFDPPVAGKFILIKLWAPCPNANIDIQSIVAHGYAGTRFFPALELR